jgi:NAD(P)-dependent dehydrogenase (short-subunit alcohol dehydrogenase family)
VWYGCKHGIIAMRKNKADAAKGLGIGGSIINVASFVAKLGAAPQLAYTASKGAVLALTRELAMIHAREAIRFNASARPHPHPLLMDYLNTPEKLNRRLVHCPMGRFGEAVEQAKAVVFREFDVAARAKQGALSPLSLGTTPDARRDIAVSTLASIAH